MSSTTDLSVLRDAAVSVLRLNDLGTMTTAAPNLYPHMWSWDAGFVAIGLARVDVPRAIVELQTLLTAQWSNGMIPHIVFSPDEDLYFPGPDRWGTDTAAARPRHVRTSGICQPPVHAIALRHILDRADENGGDDHRAAWEFAEATFDSWLHWHRWLASARDPSGQGLVEIHHGWESGFDNSPRWDESYARVSPGHVPPFARRDTKHVANLSERPSDAEYRKYLWLLQQMQDVHYDDDAVLDVIDFRVQDVFFSAILAAGSDVLAEIGDELRRPHDAAELRSTAARFRAGVFATLDPVTGLARDRDVLADAWISRQTIAGFAPLICGGGGDSTKEAVLLRQRQLLTGRDWMGHPTLRYPLPPSTSPSSTDYRTRTYWRGPVWPFMNLLFGWALARDGHGDLYDSLRTASLQQLGDLAFGEYYQPVTGEPLGSHAQAWTAAAALEWIGRPKP